MRESVVLLNTMLAWHDAGLNTNDCNHINLGSSLCTHPVVMNSVLTHMTLFFHGIMLN